MRVLSVAVCLGVLLLPGERAAAQGAEFEITPFIGGAFFLSDLGPARNGTLGAATVNDLVQSNNNSFAIGGRVGLSFGVVAIEGTFAYVPTEIATVGDVTHAADQSIILAGADVLLKKAVNPFFGLFAAGGVGIKSSSADDPFEELQLQPLGFSAGTDFMFDVGAGIWLDLFPSAALRFDVRDYISSFDVLGVSTTQHDLLVTAGLTWRPAG
jgi:hypothetical protein